MTGDLAELRERLSYLDVKMTELGKRAYDFSQANISVDRVSLPETGWSSLIALADVEPPIDIRIESGMYANELRSILDALIWILLDRKPPTAKFDERRVQFPIAKSEELYDAHARTAIGPLSLDCQRTIRTFEPWKESGNGIFFLREADNARKHRLLLASGGNVSLMTFGPPEGQLRLLYPKGVILPCGVPLKIAEIRDDVNFGFRKQLCFAEPKDVEVMSIGDLLNTSFETVSSIVAAFN